MAREQWRNKGGPSLGKYVFKYGPGKMRVVQAIRQGYKDVLNGEIYNRSGQGSNNAFYAIIPEDEHFVIMDILK